MRGGAWFLGQIAVVPLAHVTPLLPLAAMIDHLVYATPHLDRTLDELAEACGVRASAGGQHPGAGTRNAILTLGPRTYLEVIGPDPEQPDHQSPRWFGIDTLERPRLVTWAAQSSPLPDLVARAAALQLPIGQIASGQRQRPDGVVLQWRLTDPGAMIANGVVPFFIDWGESPHPASSTRAVVALRELGAVHSTPHVVREWLDALGVPIPIGHAPHAALHAILDTPRGEVLLR